MTTDRALYAGQRFLLASKIYWTTTLYPRLREEYLAHTGGQPQGTVADVAAIVEDLTLYRYFAWLERHLQRMKYSGRYGLAEYYKEHRERQLQALGAADEDDSRLDLSPELKMPRYYTAVDIHQHPGGVWSRDEAGLVYEHGARSTTPLLGSAHADLHSRFTDYVAQQFTPSSVLDMGCGFGKSTLPFAQRFDGARVEAVDLSAPCLRVAAHLSRSEKMTNVHFSQRDAAETGFRNAEFDLVTSTMLLHEMPPDALMEMLDEAYRVLEPGGRMVHLDFYYFPDAFTRFMHYGHGRRNNEPYMQPLAELDLPKLLKARGFIGIDIAPFRETESLGQESLNTWRLPWTVISAKKPVRSRRRA